MEDDTLQIGASEFKAKCLDLMDKLAARKLSRIVVTKHG
jgi:ABC-type polysaccharide/polyol phosphate transport system ATPase subunit